MMVKRKSDYLAHHGIKGQSWGDQNGPPYPLDSQVSSAVKKNKSKSFIQKLKDKKKGKKLQEARKKKAEEKKKTEEIINSGDEKKIKKIQHKLTDEEYQRALNRIDLNRKLNSVNYDNINKKLQMIGNAATTIGNIGSAANNILGAVDKGLNVKKTLKGESADEKYKKEVSNRASIAKDLLAITTAETQIKGINVDEGKRYLNKLWSTKNGKNKEDTDGS